MDLTLPETLSPASLATLADTLEQPSRHLVLRGATEQTFCNGLDLQAGAESYDVDAFIRVIRAIRCGPAAIAVVDGAARGAGVGLAAACDFVMVSDGGSFALTELWLGLNPSAIWPIVLERVSPAKLRWMGLTGRAVSAAEAVSLGLADIHSEKGASVQPLLAQLRGSSPEAILRLKCATAPMGTVAIGAQATKQRLSDPSVQSRIARFLDGEAPWD